MITTKNSNTLNIPKAEKTNLIITKFGNVNTVFHVHDTTRQISGSEIIGLVTPIDRRIS